MDISSSEKVVKVEREFTLVLSETEAAALMAITGSISGNTPVRTIADSVYYGLSEAGVDSSSAEYKGFLDSISASMFTR